MANKRKYPKVVGYWVYSLYVPSIDSYYIGISKQQCSERWRKGRYKETTLEQYLDEWDNIVKTVIQDGLTKEQAVQLEDELVIKYRNENRCVNQYRSGWICKNDIIAYNREFRNNNREHCRNYYRQYREKNREELNKYQKEYQKKLREKNREEVNRKQRERYHKRKAKKKTLENQQEQEQLTLFDLESFDIAS